MNQNNIRQNNGAIYRIQKKKEKNQFSASDSDDTSLSNQDFCLNKILEMIL